MTSECGYQESPFDTYDTYESFNEAKRFLLYILDEIDHIVSGLGLEEAGAENSERARHLITKDVFRILFIGGFSRGKSTVVNALLGEKILPSKLSPATAVITILKYGEDKQATIVYKDKNRGSETVSIEKLRDYVIIPEGSHIEDEIGSRIDTPIEKIEITYPFELLKNGVEIIDTPGLEDDYSRNKITMDYLPKSDAAIVVLSSQQLLTQDETRLIKEELIPRGFNHIFYLINFADELDSPKEEKEVISRFTKIIGSEEKVFLISGRESLDAKIYGDVDDPYLKPFSEFEKQLENFVVTQRGPYKIKTATLLVKSLIDDYKILISTARHLVEERSLDDLAQIEQEFKNRKRLLLARKDDSIEEIGKRTAQLADKVELSFIRRCDQIEESIDALSLGETTKMSTIGKMFKRDEYKNNILTQYHAYVSSEIRDWADTEASDIVRAGMEDLSNFASEEVREISKEIDVLINLLNPEFEVSLEHKNTSMERLLAAIGGLLIGDLGVAVSGGLLGPKDAAINFGAVVAANAGLYFVGLLNPLTAIVTSLVTTGVILNVRSGQLDEEMRRQVADAVKGSVRNLKKQERRNIREKVFEEVQACGRAMEQAIDNRIRDLEFQLEKAMEDATADKQKKIAAYEDAENRIMSLDEAL